MIYSVLSIERQFDFQFLMCGWFRCTPFSSVGLKEEIKAFSLPNLTINRVFFFTWSSFFFRCMLISVLISFLNSVVWPLDDVVSCVQGIDGINCTDRQGGKRVTTCVLRVFFCFFSRTCDIFMTRSQELWHIYIYGKKENIRDISKILPLFFSPRQIMPNIWNIHDNGTVVIIMTKTKFLYGVA